MQVMKQDHMSLVWKNAVIVFIQRSQTTNAHPGFTSTIIGGIDVLYETLEMRYKQGPPDTLDKYHLNIRTQFLLLGLAAVSGNGDRLQVICLKDNTLF